MSLSIVDTATRANGPLGSTPSGQPWSVLTGSVTINNGRFVTSGARSIAVIDATSGDVTVDADTGSSGVTGGYAIYFRVTDANNWWRLATQATSSTYTYNTGNTSYSWSQSYIDLSGNSTGVLRMIGPYDGSAPNFPTTYNGGHKDGNPEMYRSDPETATGTSYAWGLRLEKCVAGNVTAVQTVGLPDAATHLRVIANGSSITGWCSTVSNATVTQRVSATDGFNAAATKQGLGFSETTTYGNAEGLDNFSVAAVNRAPSVPTVTTPNGGQVFNTTAAITWSAATDPDGDPVRYEVEYTVDNGATWTRIVSDLDALSYTWNTSAVPASTACRVRVRARDSAFAYSTWDESNANFTIQHNQAPLAPTLNSPVNNAVLDRAIPQRFSWTFQDPDVGDSQSKYDIQYRVGTGAWTMLTVTSPNTFRDFAGGTFAAGAYEWQVRTYDAQGLPSQWSGSSFVTLGDTPGAPSITDPLSGGTIPTASGVVAWSAPAQAAYRVRRVKDVAGSPDTTTVYYDSGSIISTTARNAALTFDVNNRYEHVQVQIQLGGLWSSWASVRVHVAYTPPSVPVVGVEPDEETASIVVYIANLAPEGTQPVTTANEVWRSEPNRAPVRVAVRVPTNAAWIDYTPASGIDYSYGVVAIGANGTTVASNYARTPAFYPSDASYPSATTYPRS